MYWWIVVRSEDGKKAWLRGPYDSEQRAQSLADKIVEKCEVYGTKSKHKPLAKQEIKEQITQGTHSIELGSKRLFNTAPEPIKKVDPVHHYTPTTRTARPVHQEEEVDSVEARRRELRKRIERLPPPQQKRRHEEWDEGYDKPEILGVRG